MSKWLARLIILSTLLSSASFRAQQAQTILEGILSIIWGDPDPQLGPGGKTIYTLVLVDGTTVPLQLTGLEGTAAYYFGKAVIVSGRMTPNQFDITQNDAASMMVVDTIAPGRTAQIQSSIANVVGTKKVIYLLVKFSDDSAVPHPASFYTNLNNPDTPPAAEVFPTTINGFFKKTSWDQFSWIGDSGGVGGVGASGGWLTLPQPKSFYAPCGSSSSCANLQAIANDATALGRAQGINFTNYDNINIVLSNDLDCCAWGGSYYSSVDNKVYGTTWEPPWGQETGTYAHEMGHSLGLPHSGWVYYAYDSPWDMMSSRASAQSVVCGSYNSKNSGGLRNVMCTEPGDGYIAAHKDYLGWIPTANQVTTNSSSNATVTLEADALPLSSYAKILKICLAALPCSGASAHYVTVEARVKGLGPTSQYDNGIPGEGIIIQDFLGNRPAISGLCYFNNQSGWALPIDSTPNDYDTVNCNPGGRSYPNYALFNAQWNAGQTYTNVATGVTIRVLSRTGSTFVVSIGPNRRRGQVTSF
jgi:M6 family metalloprotease-like protein